MLTICLTCAVPVMQDLAGLAPLLMPQPGPAQPSYLRTSSDAIAAALQELNFDLGTSTALPGRNQTQAYLHNMLQPQLASTMVPQPPLHPLLGSCMLPGNALPPDSCRPPQPGFGGGGMGGNLGHAAAPADPMSSVQRMRFAVASAHVHDSSSAICECQLISGHSSEQQQQQQQQPSAICRPDFGRAALCAEPLAIPVPCRHQPCCSAKGANKWLCDLRRVHYHAIVSWHFLC